MRMRATLAALVPASVVAGRLRRDRSWLRPVAPLAAVTAPLAFWLAAPRGRFRAAGTWALQMWAYKVLFEMPYDKPSRLRRRLHVDYPIAADRAVGGGVPPPQRLQRALRADDRVSALDVAITGLYFTWELWPHAVLGWILRRRPDRFAHAAATLGATIDLTLLGYWLVPTAPPWWGSQVQGRMDGDVQRIATETRRALRGQPRRTGHESRGANPWAAMPSDHFASSVSAALVLSELGAREGTIGWAYALALGFALVYLGEHHVIDLTAGALLAGAVKLSEARLSGAVAAVAAELERVDARIKG